RKAVRFGYRQRSWGVEGQAAEPAVRELQPWGVVAWRGRWYVVGHDLQRGAPRCFRLSRVTGEVKLFGSAASYSPPEDLNLLSYVAKFAPPEHKNVARIRVGRHGAVGLRRWASSVEPDPDSEGGDPTDVLTLSYDRREWFAARLTAYGAAVTVLEPADLREEVIARLLVLAGTPSTGAASFRSALAGRSV
ncbi:MAG: helix-turn-helix transcriptional regulator, partial [Mycobacteriales bacterium]